MSGFALTSSIPVLRVSDYARARDFWVNNLGFQIAEEAGSPETRFGILERDHARVFLNSWDGPAQDYSGWRAYFHITDMAALENDLKSKGVAFKGPTLTNYGMQEIEVEDPDGNVVCFGTDA